MQLDETYDPKPSSDQIELPLVPLLDTVLFPHMVVPLGASRQKSLNAIEQAAEGSNQVVFVAQRPPAKDDVGREDLFDVGTIANLGQVMRLPDGSMHVLVQGLTRGVVLSVTQDEPYFRAIVQPIHAEAPKTVEVEALMTMVAGQLEQYVQLSEKLPAEVAAAAKTIEDPGWLADLFAFSPDLTFEQRQALLETFSPVERLQQVLGLLQHQLEVLEVRTKIQSEVQAGVDKHQREFFLREQLRAIQKELEEVNPELAIADELVTKLEKSGMPAEVKEKARKEMERMRLLPAGTPEIGIVRTYLDWLVDLPWAEETPDAIDLVEAARILDEDHYGLRQVKERLLEYMAVRKLAGSRMPSPILCFLGPPGVGKTSLGRSIARAMGRKFVRVSLGGVRDEAEIRGHRRTYIGSMPGRIIKGIKDAGTRNPVFMLDEIDKVGADFRGDPSAALLEVLDPEQNWSFSDHYLEVPFDLSRVVFIATANVLDTVPPALRDRMEVIELPGYTEEEKLNIACKFLLPKQIVAHGLSDKHLLVRDEAIVEIIRHYTKEAGVRNLERELAAICRKVARRVADGQTEQVEVRAKDVFDYLGPTRFSFGLAEEADEIGVATGLAWTEQGGDVLAVEVCLMEGKGDLLLTGQLGKVMQESAQAAVSYARSRSRDFGINPSFFDKHNIHIHVPAGAIPKDGPSAGVTMATALLSALTRRAARRDVAMTGEITLRGRVLPIGGVKEKVLAAHRAGITTVIVPKQNLKDLHEVPEHVRAGVQVIGVDLMEEILEQALHARLARLPRAA